MLCHATWLTQQRVARAGGFTGRMRRQSATLTNTVLDIYASFYYQHVLYR